MFSFNSGMDIPSMNAVCDDTACSKLFINDDKLIKKLKDKRIKAIKIADNTFKIKINKNKNLVATMREIGNAKFLKQIINECEDDECELISEPNTHYWDVDRLSDNTFIIKRRV